MVEHRAARSGFLVTALALVATLTSACSSSKGSGTTGAGGSHTSATASAGSTGGAGTGGKAGTGGVGAGGRPADAQVTPDLQGRTYDIFVPANNDPTKPAPLMFEIHGFLDASQTTTPGAEEEAANHFQPETDKRGVILVLPKGTVDPILNHYVWNATEACCGWDIAQVNDVAYLLGIIEDVKKKYAVDDKRIFVFGHSGGGFMANRFACDEADKIAAVVSLAGETFKDQTECLASAPIAFLEVQGDADTTVPFGGGPPFGVAAVPNAPGAVETAADWAKKNRCGGGMDASQPDIDIVADLAGAETSKVVYKGCEAPGATELWTIKKGVHSPNFNANWAPDVLDFMMAHPRP